MEDERELVTPEPRHRLPGPDHAEEPEGDRLEQIVPRLVPEAVVDDLEPVEVEEHDGETAAGSGRVGELQVEPVEEQRPIGESRERIVHGLVGERLGGGHLFRDVLHRGHEAGRGPFLSDHRGGQDPNISHFPGGPQQPEVDSRIVPALAGGQGRCDDAAAVVGMDTVEPAVVTPKIVVDPGDLVQAGVEVLGRPVLGHLEDADRRVRGDGLEAPLALHVRASGAQAAPPQVPHETRQANVEEQR